MCFAQADKIAWKNRDIYDQHHTREAAEKWLHKRRHPKPNISKLVLYSVIDDLYCANCDADRYTDITPTHQFLCNGCHEEHKKKIEKKQPAAQQQKLI